MQNKKTCRSEEHLVARRGFLQGAALAGSGFLLGGGLARLATANELAAGRRKMLVIFLDGGLSQLESWDPKPGTDEGGPFRAIPTSVPGIHISELLPHTAKQMHHLALVRSVSTGEKDHTPAKYLMETGRNMKTGSDFPYLCAAAASKLVQPDDVLPPYVIIQTSNYHLGHAGFLSARFSGVNLARAKPPKYLTPPEGVSAETLSQRTSLRSLFDQRLVGSRRTADTEAYTASFTMADRMAQQRDVFDLSKEPQKEQDRYGKHDFGRHCLLARRLLESDVPCIQVRHRAYDSHFENFNIHLEQLREFDLTFATLMDDLHERGLLESTLVIVMSEMGRTPKINNQMGRDHWNKSWSIALGGGGIQPGAVYGKTDNKGIEILDGKVDQSDLFHTFYRAVGIDPNAVFDTNVKTVPLAEPAHGPIEELLT